MSNKHPRLPFKPSPWTYGINAVTCLILFGMLIYLFIIYRDLPNTIPIHFNAQGEADNWGSKLTIFILPVIAVIMFIGLYILGKFPHSYNYPFTVTEKNAPQFYRAANLFVALLNLIVTAVFSLAAIDMVLIGELICTWFILYVVGSFIVWVALFIYALWKIKERTKHLD